MSVLRNKPVRRSHFWPLCRPLHWAWGGWAGDLPLPLVFAQAFLSARLMWRQTAPSYVSTSDSMQWGLFPFFPSGSDPPWLWCILKSPAHYFPLSPKWESGGEYKLHKFGMRWKKKENSFLCCRNDKGNSFHMCPGAQIVKTDVVLSPSLRCGCFFSGEVRRGELNKLIWVFFSSSISCQDLLRKKNIKRAKAGKDHLAYLVHFLKSKQTFKKTRITPYPFTLFPCTEDGRV